MTDIRFEHPELLWGLALLPLLWLLTWRSRALLSVRSKVACSLVRSLVLAMVVAALSQPFRMIRQEQKVPTGLALLVDRSGSVAGDTAELDARCEPYRLLGDLADRVVDLEFAGAVSLRDASPAALDLDATDIGGALDHAAAEMAAAQGAVVLVTDGRSTRGDPLKAAARLRAAGLRVYVVPVGRHRQAGPRITGVEPPSQARVKEPARIRVHLKSDVPAKVDVRLMDGAGIEVDRQVIDCDGSRALVLRHVPAESGLQRCTVLLADSSDIEGEQTMVSVPYYVEGPPKVLVVDSIPQEAGPLAAALSSTDLVVERRSAADLSLSPEELNTYEAVVLSDVARPEFDAATQDALVRYVEEQGGGLVFIGGRNVSAERWQGSPLAGLLPVQLQPEKVRVIEQLQPVHVCFVLDKSGSMDSPLDPGGLAAVSKMQRVKDAVQASVAELPPTAIISVVVFDSQTRVLVDSVPVDQWAGRGARLVDRIAADGGTTMDPAIEAAINLIKAKPVPGHIILLTDGMTDIAGNQSPQARYGDLVTWIRDGGISLTTVAVGADSAQALLEYLATAAGGIYYFCENADEIPRIFVRQAQTIRQVSRIDRPPFAPQAGRYADLIRNIPLGSYPLLSGALSSSDRPLSQVVLTTDQGKPLLAEWQYGLGRVVAFTSDAKGVWAGQWVRWQDFGRFWNQVLGRVLRRLERLRTEIEPSVDGRDARILLRAYDTNGHPATGLKASAAATPLSGQDPTPVALTWREVRPGVYEGRAALSQPGNHLCQIHLQRENVVVDRALVLRPDDSAEMAETGPDMATLTAIAEVGGGCIDPGSDQVARDLQQTVIRKIPLAVPYWPWLVIGAALLWPVDVAGRRLLT